MYYYQINLPIQTKLKRVIYRSPNHIAFGVRVIVIFGNRTISGICGEEVSEGEVDKNLRIRDVLEVLDEESILPLKMYKLAEWMAKYYRCETGRVLFTMLPSVIVPEIATQVKWIHKSEVSDAALLKLQSLLRDNQFHSIKEIKPSFANHPFYKMLETTEAAGLIEIKRSFDQKVKPKTINILKLTTPPAEPNLTPKQQEALEIIKNLGDEIPMSSVSEQISFSLIKALAVKGYLTIIPRQVESRCLIFPQTRISKDITLTSEQQGIIQKIISDSSDTPVHLIYGITGSGKTEIYIEVIKNQLTRGKNVIMLIPEIALTPQMVDRFYGAFGSTIAILHSQLTERQRYEQWRDIKDGKCRIVIGARSAVFAPLQDVGLIIVDEEHEQSYKQESTPRYNGRDVAIVRAKLEGAAVILGSATPSLESWHNAQKGKFRLHTLTSRPTPQGLPEVKLVDMREKDTPEELSLPLREAIQQNLEKKEQIILLQNRRGFASFVQCMKCGTLQQCPHCEISFYYHRDKDELDCHYCGYKKPIPRKCPSCGSYTFSFGAPGTQKIEQLLKVYFPAARILRLDSDSSRRKDIYTYMYEMMKKEDIDILLGTQMIAKGLDFPNVTLVGVILADITLNVPDFRAAERTFHLLTQVAGRSGRGHKEGRVIIQTYNPEHYAIHSAMRQDYLGFAKEELEYRRRLYYPPHYRLARLLFTAADEKKLRQILQSNQKVLQNIRQKFSVPELIMLGPSPAPLTKVNNQYRHHLILKAKDSATLSLALGILEQSLRLPATIGLAVDIDPINLM